jgi:branched-subunit amino acid ABC-type transport system permease component
MEQEAGVAACVGVHVKGCVKDTWASSSGVAHLSIW